MRFSGACVGMVLAAAGGAGCHTGGTLTGSGGVGTLSGVGGKAGGSGNLSGIGGGSASGLGGASVVGGTAGVGPAAGTGGTYDDGCRGPIPAKRLPANILIVVDTSSSMNDTSAGVSCGGGCGGASKWSALVSGLDSVVGVHGLTVNWGLQLLGAGDACTAGPVVVTNGEGTDSLVMDELARQSDNGNVRIRGTRPTREAVRTAGVFLSLLPVPGQRAILLLTDGEPRCALGAADAAASDAAATVAAITDANNVGVPTFVIGVGTLDPSAEGALSQMARAGGLARSGSPSYFAASEATDVFNAVNRLVATVGECAFAVPDPPGTSGATSRSNIAVVVNGDQIPHDTSHTNGWDYVDASQMGVQLYGPSCDAVTAGLTPTVSVLFLCLLF